MTMTYDASTSNPVRNLAGNKAGGLDESREVNSVPTVSVGAVHPKAAPDLGDAAFRVTVSQAPAPGDWTADGAGFAASVPVSVTTVNDNIVEADERFYLAVTSADGQPPLGSDCPAELRNVGGGTHCASAVTIEENDIGVTGVTVTSMPQKAADTMARASTSSSRSPSTGRSR